MNDSLSPSLKLALKAARKCGNFILGQFGKEQKIFYKNGTSPVSQVDKDAEILVRKIILSETPSAKFVGEELGEDSHRGTFWTIDPLDGTRDFLKGSPIWGTLISYVEDGKVKIGVYYFPILKTLLYAQSGVGAFVNGGKTQVSKTDDLSRAYMHYGNLKYFKNQASIVNLINSVMSARSYIGLYYLAKGTVDICVEARNELWDIAPFKIIIEEAGGKLTNLSGEEWKFSDKDFIATNGLLHSEVVKILNT